MPGHCEGSLVSSCRISSEGVAGGRKERAKRLDSVKSKREDSKESTARGYWCELPRIPASPPPGCRLFTLGGYRLTAIRLNLFHHKRLNKEVHSLGPATALRSSLAPFRSVGCPYRPLSTTYDHPSGSPSFLKRKVRSYAIATSAIVRRIFSRYNCTSYVDKSLLIRRTGVGA